MSDFHEAIFPFIVVISRDEVERKDTAEVARVLKSCISSPERARTLFEKLDISFEGYDEDRRELFEIQEVRRFVYKLDETFPYWLYFLTKKCSGLLCITLCFLPPYLTDAARAIEFPKHLDELLSGRWFPAMNHICAATGFSEQQIEELTNRVIAYIGNGPQLK